MRWSDARRQLSGPGSSDRAASAVPCAPRAPPFDRPRDPRMLNLAYDALRAQWDMGGLTTHRRPFLIKDRTLDCCLVVQFLHGEARVVAEGDAFVVRP